jgi:CRP-like cAMP-binding protein
MDRTTLALKEAEIFLKVTDSQLENIARICTEQTFNTGDIILVEGSHGDELYIIARGEVDITINPSLVSPDANLESQPVTISTLRRGQSFGEIALVDHGIRSATVRATQHNTRVLVIPSNELLSLCESDPSLGFRVMHNLAADLAMKVRNNGLFLRDTQLNRDRYP